MVLIWVSPAPLFAVGLMDSPLEPFLEATIQIYNFWVKFHLETKFIEHIAIKYFENSSHRENLGEV